MQLVASCRLWKLPAAPVAAAGRLPHHLAGARVSGPPNAAPCRRPGPEAGGGESRSVPPVLLAPAPAFGASHPLSVAVVSRGRLGAGCGGDPSLDGGAVARRGLALLSASRRLAVVAGKPWKKWLVWAGFFFWRGWCGVLVLGFVFFLFFSLAEAKAAIAIRKCRIMRQGSLQYLIHIHFHVFKIRLTFAISKSRLLIIITPEKRDSWKKTLILLLYIFYATFFCIFGLLLTS